jgi:hypothetical protein
MDVKTNIFRVFMAVGGGTTLSIMTLSTTTFNISTFSIMQKALICDTQHN